MTVDERIAAHRAAQDAARLAGSPARLRVKASGWTQADDDRALVLHTLRRTYPRWIYATEITLGGSRSRERRYKAFAHFVQTGEAERMDAGRLPLYRLTATVAARLAYTTNAATPDRRAA